MPREVTQYLHKFTAGIPAKDKEFIEVLSGALVPMSRDRRINRPAQPTHMWKRCTNVIQPLEQGNVEAELRSSRGFTSYKKWTHRSLYRHPHSDILSMTLRSQ
jgi:hypothetical protein